MGYLAIDFYIMAGTSRLDNMIHLASHEHKTSWCGRTELHVGSLQPLSTVMQKDGSDFMTFPDFCPHCRQHMVWLDRYGVAQRTDQTSDLALDELPVYNPDDLIH